MAMSCCSIHQRARCLQALMVEIATAPPPEALRHAMPRSQERLMILSQYRGALEYTLAKLMLSTWRSCARQVFAAVGPVRFIAEGRARHHCKHAHWFVHSGSG